MDRLDPELLDPDDPFEIDEGNRPHLFNHPPYGVSDVEDVFYEWPLFFEYEGDGSADWIMVGEVPGGDPEWGGPLVLAVPLAKSNRGTPHRARPITIYKASRTVRARYLEER